MKLCVIILNYRRAPLTIDCLRALEGEIANQDERCAVVIDNGSDDDSADAIGRAIDENGWGAWARLVRSHTNLGFAGGNNLGFRSVDAGYYLLLNSDARPQSGSISSLLGAMEREPHVGAIGPRLQDDDGTPQVSCFRYRTPVTEFLHAASTGPVDRMFSSSQVAMGVFNEPMEPPWLSFACIMIRKSVIEQIGPMDDGYFMYFEDIDYSRQMRKAGWNVIHLPEARVVHLRGGTSSVKAAIKVRARIPKYYYESRSRYFAKFYGGIAGLWMTNFLWLLGRAVSWIRERFGRKERVACEREGRDNWTNWLHPMRAPTPQRGGEL